MYYACLTVGLACLLSARAEDAAEGCLISRDKYVQSCYAWYSTPDGWSDRYEVEVSFMRGEELNEATGTVDYEGHLTYACIWWDPGKVSVIELEWRICDYDKGCDVDDFRSFTRSGSDGTDQQGRRWYLCWASYCHAPD